MLRILFFLIFTSVINISNAQTQIGAKEYTGLVNWLSLEKAQELNKINPKPIMIDIYTDWCGWCKKMQYTTFADPQVAGYLNENFYPVRFDAETRDTIKYLGQTYYNRSQGNNPTHELTFKFLPQSRSYPSIIFMNGEYQYSLLYPGYMDAKTIAPFLVFYKEMIYKSSNVNDFMAFFDSTFTPKSITPKKAKVKWYSMQQAIDLNKKSPKKIFVHLYNSACVSCKVMDSTTYTNPVITDYLNKNFYPVRFAAESKDTINILNQKLVNIGGYHQLVTAALKDKLEFPSTLFFNENSELITPVPQYMTPKFFEAVLAYFKEDKFKTVKFDDFFKSFKSKI